ncbi:MAG: hypothetical protein KIT84_43430 [Labilithrix sp.]|nr:hypothetical protein [Labilithrix sp.]MCW5817931.1 hypothetical protein [Labilithrix sp.]
MSTSLMQTTLAAAAQVLAPPHRQLASSLQTTVLQGTYRGHAAQVMFQSPRGEEEAEIVYVSVAAPVHGVIARVFERTRSVSLGVTPGPRPSALALSWEPRFQERFDVGGAPSAVLSAWLTPEVQSRILDSGVRRLSTEEGELKLTVRRPADAAGIAAALDVTIELLTRLPPAIQAAGLGSYLPGSLATHPDVVALQGFERRSRRVGGLLIALFLLLFVGVFAACVAACVACGPR